MSMKIFKTLIPRNRCVQVICTQPQNCFIWIPTNSQLCVTERVFPQYDSVTVLWKNTQCWSQFIVNLFYRRDHLNGHVNIPIIPVDKWSTHIHDELNERWKRSLLLRAPNMPGYIKRTPWVGSLFSWTPSIKSMPKNSVTTHAQLGSTA